MLVRTRRKTDRVANSSFAIVASRYNSRYVEGMLSAARTELKRAGAKRIQIIRVPGAFEIPIAAARLARLRCFTPEYSSSPPTLDAIICLGVVLRGETVHADLITEAVTWALMELQLRYELPVIHEVLLLETHEQARTRCLSKTHNRGTEAAQAALSMARLMRNI